MPHLHDAPGALSPWDLVASGILVGAGCLYALGSQRARRRGAVSRVNTAAFWTGWIVLLASVLPPIDQLAVERFVAHMAQHELMMLVGVPLIIAGRALTVWLDAVPHPTRAAAIEILRQPPISLVQRWGTLPIVAWALHGLAIWVWHVPVLYDAAVGNEALHAFQHATFVGTSALFWWGVLQGRYGRAGYGAAVVFVFTTAVHTGVLGAMLTFAPRAIYPWYASAAHTLGFDALQDQQRGGLLMWIPAGFVFALLGVALCAAWLGDSERIVRHLDRSTGAGLPEADTGRRGIS
jgi:putative membrane protein